jgi:hypothetical protein
MIHEEPAPIIPRHHIEKRNYKRSQAEKAIDLKSDVTATVHFTIGPAELWPRVDKIEATITSLT